MKIPSPHEVEEYAKSIDFNVNGDYFVSYYDARGWLLGKNKIKCWKACVRTWKARSKDPKLGVMVQNVEAFSSQEGKDSGQNRSTPTIPNSVFGTSYINPFKK